MPDANLPAFETEQLDYPDLLVNCTRCENGFIVHGPTFFKGSGDTKNRSTRPCPYCDEESLATLPKYGYREFRTQKK